MTGKEVLLQVFDQFEGGEQPVEIVEALFAPVNWEAIRDYLDELERSHDFRYTVDIPQFKPMALNEFRGSPGSRHIEQNGKQEMIGLLRKYAEHIPKVTDTYRPKRRIRMWVFYGKGTRRHDKDAFDKVAKDAIKRAGLIVDDSLQWVDWEVRLERDSTLPEKQHRTFLEIWDIGMGKPKAAKKIARAEAKVQRRSPQKGLLLR